MLPHEAEVMAEITKKYRVQLEAMTDLHNAIVAMMTAGSWAITKKRGVTRFVVETMMGLLVKACKTFRSVQLLCERGLYGDASALVRVLMETTSSAILFILQTKSTQRTLMYHAHGLSQLIKMLNEWTTTPGLKRLASKRMIQQATHHQVHGEAAARNRCEVALVGQRQPAGRD